MAAAETLEISLKADMRELVSALKELPDIGSKEARDMVRGIQREYKKAEAAAKSLAKAKKDAGKETEQLGKNLRGTAKIAGGFGGTIGGVASMVQNFAEGLAESTQELGANKTALLAVGGGATLMAGSLALGVTQLFAIADGALAAREELKETKGFYRISDEDIASLERYAAATDYLNTKMNELKVSSGAALADNLAVLKVRGADVAGNVAEAATANDGFVRSAVRVMSLGVADYFLGVADAEKEAELGQLDNIAAWNQAQKDGQSFLDFLGDMAEANTEQAEGLKSVAERERELAEQRKKAEAEAAKAAAKAKARAAEMERANERLRDMADSATLASLSGTAKVEEAYRQRIATIEELAAVGQDQAATQAALDAAQAQRDQELQALQLQHIAVVQKAAEEAEEADKARAQAEADRIVFLMEMHRQLEEKKKEEAEKSEEEARQEAKNGIALWGDFTNTVSDLFEQGAENMSKSDKARARAMAAAARATSLLGVGVKTAEAVMTGFAMFGPPPSPLGILSSVNALAAGAAQAAAIKKEPLPSFFGGSARMSGSGQASAGEVTYRGHGNEAMLNASATSNIGPQIIDALNAGMAPLAAMGGGGGGDVYLDGQLVGRSMAPHAKRPGPLRDALVGRSRVPGFRSPFGRN